MGLMINTIITLENQEKYIVLSDTIFKAKKYYLVMGIDENQDTDAQNVAIMEESIEGLDIFVIKVEDPELKYVLTDLLKAQQ